MAMNDAPLWWPSKTAVSNANLSHFMERVGCASYDALYDFSINHCETFWLHIWDFCKIKGHLNDSAVLTHKEDIEKAQFFPNATLNYAENLLVKKDHTPALLFFGENHVHESVTWESLYNQVAKLADCFKKWGLQPGDRVAAYLPNLPQTIVAFLATASLGGIWSSCSPDFGVESVIDRFGQISPKILLVTDGHFYNGRPFDGLEKIASLEAGLPSVEHIIVVPYTGADSASILKKKKGAVLHHLWTEILNNPHIPPLDFVQLPFNHPLCILYSSGTTGAPKCIMHGAGGTLIQHLKEHQLHCDLKPNDVFFYFTTCGWMMWNWLVSGLASGATLVLYDGSPLYPTPNRLFDLIDQSNITVFGISAKYIEALNKGKVNPKTTHDLSSLRLILSTGSPLSPESFDFVYTHVKQDVCLSSISGGTDIVSCFALGNPIAPVWRGELQTRGLGLKVDVFDETGTSLKRVNGETDKGELVCTAPFPSRPLGFWDDAGGALYHKAYFKRFPGVWHHGDFVELTSHNGLIIHGRSDTILNPGGIRIGTAEIYRQVEQIDDILESLVVGQRWQNDVRIILFVRLKPELTLTSDLTKTIQSHIRTATTPRHVPAKIIQVPDIPRTKNGKIAELAVKNTIHNESVQNKDALLNPESLIFYQHIQELNN